MYLDSVNQITLPGVINNEKFANWWVWNFACDWSYIPK